MAEFELNALLTIKRADQLSQSLTRLQKTILRLSKASDKASDKANKAESGGKAEKVEAGDKEKKIGAGGIAIAKGLTGTLKAYAQQEEAATRLKVAMMDANGLVGESFNKVNTLAIGLGNKLPGSAAGFQSMMQTLVGQGVSAENILNGMGEATAYLAVQLEKPPQAVAEFAAQIQKATGTAAADMMGLFDTVQKASSMGVDDGNMLSFFSQTSAVMKMVNKDGLAAAKSLAPLAVMMGQMHIGGEDSGSALSQVIQSGMDVKNVRAANKQIQGTGVALDFTDGNGNFGGLDNLFSQLEKLQKLSAGQRTSVLQSLFGDDGNTLAVANALIDQGKDGYDQIQQRMNNQASLSQRVATQLGTLSNLWESLTDSVNTALAAIGGAFSGEAKGLTTWLADMSERFSRFAAENPRIVRSLFAVAAGLAVVKLGFLAVGNAMGIASQLAAMTPLGRIISVIAMGAGLIIANWDVIGPFFQKIWDSVTSLFAAGMGVIEKVLAWSPLDTLNDVWGSVVKWFKDMWEEIKPIIGWFFDDKVNEANDMKWGPGGSGIYDTGSVSRGYNPYAMPPPAQGGTARLTVDFNGAPPGMRVTDTQSSNGFLLDHDVGYNYYRSPH